jgi:predicted flavoprotein YhiN
MPNPTVLVVGAGAAGLTAAIRAAEAGARVTLLNAHPKVGLKILMSGGTRCNVTHATVTERDFFGGSRNVVARILRSFTAAQTLTWFQDELGVPLKLEQTGKYFPVSDDAQTVLDGLLGAAEGAGVELRAGARAVRLERVGASEEGAPAPAPRAHLDVEPVRSKAERTSAAAAAGAGGTRFRVGVQRIADSAALGSEVAPAGQVEWPLPPAAPDEWLDADAVIVATGGLSFPRTGSDGTGYALLTALGHTLVTPVPALTPLASPDPFCMGARGVTTHAALTLWVDGKKAETREGSLLFTHFGLSGPVALDLSRHWHRAEGHARRVTINFLPGESEDMLTAEWVGAGERRSGRGSRSFLGARLPERIADMLTAESGLGGVAMSQTPKQRRAEMLRLVLERDLEVTATLGYEKAEVTAGGVPLSEVNASTLESRITPGLYLCGEVLDVEGRLGGFNFQWAWSSGTVAGRAAASL